MGRFVSCKRSLSWAVSSWATQHHVGGEDVTVFQKRERLGLNLERKFTRRSAELGQICCVDASSFWPLARNTGLCPACRAGGL